MSGIKWLGNSSGIPIIDMAKVRRDGAKAKTELAEYFMRKIMREEKRRKEEEDFRSRFMERSFKLFQENKIFEEKRKKEVKEQREKILYGQIQKNLKM